MAGVRCKSSWLRREHAALAEVCGELDSSVLASEVGFTEGEVCKASRVLGSLNLPRRTTLAAWKLSQCEVHGWTFFFFHTDCSYFYTQGCSEAL